MNHLFKYHHSLRTSLSVFKEKAAVGKKNVNTYHFSISAIHPSIQMSVCTHARKPFGTKYKHAQI